MHDKGSSRKVVSQATGTQKHPKTRTKQKTGYKCLRRSLLIIWISNKFVPITAVNKRSSSASPPVVRQNSSGSLARISLTPRFSGVKAAPDTMKPFQRFLALPSAVLPAVRAAVWADLA